MKCNKYQELVSTFVDSEVTPLEQLAVQQHIKSCLKCKGALEAQYELKTMFDTIKAKRNLNTDISLTSSVMARIKVLQTEGAIDRSDIASVVGKEVIHENLISSQDTIAQTTGKTFTRTYATAFVLLLTLTAFFLSTNNNSTQIVQSSSINEAAYAPYVYEHIMLDDSRYLINTSK